MEAAAEQVRLVEEETRGATGEPGRALMAFLGISIDRAYTALESGFTNVARVLDDNVPTGEDWHRALLHQMTLPIQDRRPAVLDQESARLLDPLRRHRHWLRHAYRASFEWTRLRPTVEVLPLAIERVRADLDRFIAFLQAASE